MVRTINMQEVKRQWDENPQRCERQLTEALEAGHLKPADFSIRDCFEHTIEDGYELLRLMDGRKSGFRHMSELALQEAASAVDTSAFATIAGQFAFSRIKEEYNSDQFIWPDIVETIPTVFINGEIIPGIGGIGDVAEVVEEGQPYPVVGMNEEWIQTVPTQKRGFILPITREIIIADRTGLLMQRAGRGGFFLGLNKEKRCINVATAAGKAGLPSPNNYKRNGTATNTYLTAGAYINSQTGNALSGAGNEWLALQANEILFSQILDPNTAEPIDVDMKAIIVPVALRRTAERILQATGITTVDMRAAATTIRTDSGNPYSGGNIKVLSNNWVFQITNSSTLWWAGEPKKAFAYMEVWGVETVEAAKNSLKEFENDIWQQFKVSERGVAQVIEPRYMVQSGP